MGAGSGMGLVASPCIYSTPPYWELCPIASAFVKYNQECFCPLAMESGGIAPENV